MKQNFLLNDMKPSNQDIEIELEEMDTLETQQEKPPIKFKNAFGLVLALHAVVIGGIMFSSYSLKATTQDTEDDKKFLDSPESVYVGIPEKVELPESSKSDYPRSNSSMVATLPPKYEPPKTETKIVESVPKPVSNPQPKRTEEKTKSKYTQTYQVKQGDTINSIAKKYHLVTERLMKLNNIKDPNKIYVGQTLKFL